MLHTPGPTFFFTCVELAIPKKASYEAKKSKAPQVPIICLDHFSKTPPSFFPM